MASAIPQAHAIYQIYSVILVMCPICSGIHKLPVNTGRLVPVPAHCDPGKTYVIGATMKERSLVSAIKGHAYDLERRRKPKKAKSPPEERPLEEEPDERVILPGECVSPFDEEEFLKAHPEALAETKNAFEELWEDEYQSVPSFRLKSRFVI